MGEVNLDFGSYKVLPFDSEIFGFKVAKILDLKKVNKGSLVSLGKAFKEENVRYATYRLGCSRNEDISSLQDAGFRYLDTTISLRSSLIGVPGVNHAFNFKKADVGDISTLQKKHAHTFLYSRFFKDSITRDNAVQVHRRWIENCVLGEVSDEVFILSEGLVQKGFIAVEDSGGIGHIPLIGSAVRGGGSALLSFALSEWFGKKGCDEVLIEGQADNVRAIYLYEKFGFRVYKEPELTFRWSDL